MVLDYTWERREELIRAEEYDDGMKAGMEVGMNLLSDVVRRLRAGDKEEQLRAEKIGEDVIAYAREIMKE